MMLAFTKVSNENHYVRPNINDDGILMIKEKKAQQSK